MTIQSKKAAPKVGHRRGADAAARKSRKSTDNHDGHRPAGTKAAGLATELVSKAEFSRRSGATRSQISRACRGPLRGALVGARVDARHTLALEFMAVRGRVVGVSGPAKSAPTPTPEIAPDAGPEIRELIHLRSEVERTFGSVREYLDWLKTKSAAAEAIAAERRNAIVGGRLISKDAVQERVFGLLEEMQVRLLTDAAGLIVTRLPAEVGAGAGREKLFAMAQQIIGTYLASAQRRMPRALRACRTNDNPPEVREPRQKRDHSLPRSFASDVSRRLLELAPELVEATLKSVTRAVCSASGWPSLRFDAAWEARPKVESEAISHISTLLTRCVEGAVTVALTSTARETRE